MFWLYGSGFIMGDATEENYLPGPLLDTKQVKNNHCSGCMAVVSSWETQQRRTTCLGLSSTPGRKKTIFVLGVGRRFCHGRRNRGELPAWASPRHQAGKKQSLFWLYGGGFVMGDTTEENYLPGPLLDTKQVKNNLCSGCMAVVSS